MRVLGDSIRTMRKECEEAAVRCLAQEGTAAAILSPVTSSASFQMRVKEATAAESSLKEGLLAVKEELKGSQVSCTCR